MPDTQAHSIITLWDATGLAPNKNYAIDDIHDYLISNVGLGYQISNVQFLELKPKLTVKLDLSQINLAYDEDYAFDYCYISRTGDGFENTKGAYYFIVNKNWKAKHTIELELEMDVLNTFGWNIDYTVTDKTFIKRQHKDRFSSMDFSVSYLKTLQDWPALVSYQIEIEDPRLGTEGFSIEVGGLPEGISVTNTLVSSSAEKGYITLRNSTHQTLSLVILNLTITFKNSKVLKNIDLKSEDIQTPLYKTAEETLYENSGVIEDSWVLYYKSNPNTPTAIDCFLLPYEKREIQYPTQNGQITTSMIPEGKYIIISPSFANNITLNAGGTKYKTSKSTTSSAFGENLYITLAIKNENNTLKLYRGRFRQTVAFGTPSSTIYISGSEESVYNFNTVLYTGNTIDVENTSTSLPVERVDSLRTSYDTSMSDFPFRSNSYNDTLTFQNIVAGTLNGIQSIDRTDSKNLKIINIPYSPSQLTILAGGAYEFDSLWGYDLATEFMKLVDFSQRFVNPITTQARSVLQEFETPLSLGSYLFNEDRYLIDSKMYHSDFYRDKFVYDSFSKILPLEQIDYNQTALNDGVKNFKFSFIMSRNLVSKFLFQFNFTYKHPTEDYENTLAVARNNEEALYTSAYLDYIRTGYNYDLKAKQRQEVASGVGLGLSVASLLGSIALTATGVGAGVGVAGIVGSVAGIASSSINFAKSVAQNEDNIQRRLNESRAQSTGVLNADDYDLLYAYSSNKAKLCRYQASEEMQSLLNDIFYYFGYAENDYGVPNIKSRHWFNFLQCDLLCDDWANIPMPIQEIIKQKFADGVTFFHYNEISDEKIWDIDQKKENYEEWIVTQHTGGYDASMLSNLWIDDNGEIGCIYTGPAIPQEDYIQLQYIRAGQMSPEINERQYGPITAGTHSIVLQCPVDQYMYGGSVVRARIVCTSNPQRSSDWASVTI